MQENQDLKRQLTELQGEVARLKHQLSNIPPPMGHPGMQMQPGMQQMAVMGMGMPGMGMPQPGMGMPQSEMPMQLPHRPGQKPCTYYLKYGVCKFGATCKYDHPLPGYGMSQNFPQQKHMGGFQPGQPAESPATYPSRPGEKPCGHFVEFGVCKFGASCRFDHPTAKVDEVLSTVYNTKGLPIRPGKEECGFYMRNGACKFGQGCKYNHPESTPGGVATSGTTTVFSAQGLPIRPGQEQCSFYMRTGMCKFGATCKYDHPITKQAATAAVADAQVPAS